MISVFLICAIFIFYIYGGYHIIIHLLSSFKKPLSSVHIEDWPSISVIVVMKNEEKHAVNRIKNLLNQYPNDKLEINVFLDSPKDKTKAELSIIDSNSLKIYHETLAIGKSACVSKGIQLAKHDYLIFTDARQEFESGAIKSLVRHLLHPDVGAVSGELVFGTHRNRKSISSIYWSMEKWLRKSESRLNSVIGCTGAIYAVKKFYCPISIPTDTLLDDVVIPMNILMSGKRVIYDSSAIAFDPLIPSPSHEFKRKVRTLAGNYQILFRYPVWLIPFKNSQWWQLISHKYLRLLGPYFILLLFYSSWMLTELIPIKVFAFAQTIFYLLGVLGIIMRNPIPILTISSSFILLNIASLFSLFYYLNGSYKKGWSN